MRLPVNASQASVELHIDRLVIHNSEPIAESRLIEGFQATWAAPDATPESRHVDLVNARAETPLDGPESIGSEVARAVQGVLKP